MADPVRVLFAGGGTGGHLYPAIAMADEIRRIRPESEILFVGTKGRIEERVVPSLGYTLRTIRISGLRRQVSLETVLFPFKLAMAIVQSYRIIRSWKPDVAVGTGGYVAGPVLYMATVAGIPSLIQEQNSVPGITTRLLAERADEVHLSFSDAASFLRRKDNVRVTGNPIRSEVGSVSREEGRRFFDLDPALDTILVFGGSQGAAAINKAVASGLGGLAGSSRQILWQTGEKDFAPASDAAAGSGIRERIRVYRYIDRMDCAYAAASLAVCRSGATTIAELLCAGVPSVLVPYPHAAADHQTKNALSLADAGAAQVLTEKELGKLTETIAGLFDNREQLQRIAQAARGLAKPEATRTLADAILRLGGSSRG